MAQYSRVEVAQVMKDWYDEGPEKREKFGQKGVEFVMRDDVMMSSEAMSQNFIDHMDRAFDNWKPRKRYSIFKA